MPLVEPAVPDESDASSAVTEPLSSPVAVPPLLELRNVSKQFGSQTVLRNVGFSVYRGETLAVIGESGCGKSVTMKLLLGLLKPTQGDVLFEQRRISDRSEAELTQMRLRVGYVFQGAALFDSMSVFDNVAFGLRQNFQISASAVRDIVVERLHEVGLPPSVCQKKPAELSGGMKKRVGLARALAVSPEVILYDEPTTGLDPIMSDVINELILQTRRVRPITSIVVTHDMTTVRKVADRVIMLYPVPRLAAHEPQVVFDGPTEQAFVHSDPRVGQFVRGEAGSRLMEMAQQQSDAA